MSGAEVIRNQRLRLRIEEGGRVTSPVALARRRVERAALSNSETEFRRASHILSNLLERGTDDAPAAQG